MVLAVTITWGGHHVRNIKNLNHEKLPLSTMKTIPCQPRKHPYQWSAAANHHGQLLPFSPVLRPYRPVLHVESGMLGHRRGQGLGVALLWLHCLNLTSTAPENASRLKNSKLGQNDDVLRITNSAFVQAASLCCQCLIFSLIHVVFYMQGRILTLL